MQLNYSEQTKSIKSIIVFTQFNFILNINICFFAFLWKYFLPFDLYFPSKLSVETIKKRRVTKVVSGRENVAQPFISVMLKTANIYFFYVTQISQIIFIN